MTDAEKAKAAELLKGYKPATQEKRLAKLNSNLKKINAEIRRIKKWLDTLGNPERLQQYIAATSLNARVEALVETGFDTKGQKIEAVLSEELSTPEGVAKIAAMARQNLADADAERARVQNLIKLAKQFPAPRG